MLKLIVAGIAALFTASEVEAEFKAGRDWQRNPYCGCSVKRKAR